MIRTNIVTLTTINAVAYRSKLPSGGSGITIIRPDSKQVGNATISNKTGEPVPAANTPKNLYPQEAFQEAMELTRGMPYKKQGNVKNVDKYLKKEKKEVKKQPEEIVINIDEYNKIIAKYTDKDGKFSTDLMNKDLIQFAHRSSIVRGMIDDGDKADDIVNYILGNKIRNITGNDDLTDAEVDKIIEMLNEETPKGAFTPLKTDIRQSLAKAKYN